MRPGQNDLLVIRGEHEQNTIDQMRHCMTVGQVGGGVLCADGHKGYAQPVGAVIAYEGQISVSGVGFDIACGNMAVKTDLKYRDVKGRIPEIAADINRKIAFGMGRTYGPSAHDKSRIDHPLFDNDTLWQTSGMADLKRMAEGQLGTVGGGNHYVDIFVERQIHSPIPGVNYHFDEDEAPVWIGVHFGSRGLGHKTATKYLQLAGGKDGMDVDPTVLDETSDLGIQYLAGMELAGQYAYAGREWVTSVIVQKILGGHVLDTIHNHHNYAWRETHYGRDYWVVRKGATPAFPGQRGFVGGSMGDDAVILQGVDSPEAASLLYSTVHGAGRVHSRTAAKGKFNRKTGERKTEGLFTTEQMDAWLREKGVYRVGGDVDESPMVYRRLPDVLAAQGSTIEVLHTLKPIIVVMAGADIIDPYKD